MKSKLGIVVVLVLTSAAFGQTSGASYAGPAFQIKSAKVKYIADLDLLVFSQTVKGRAGSVVPKPKGAVHGAPVLGYVFPTTLKPQDVGFQTEGGIVALAVTSHPDFDDTPLWDENGDSRWDNDGQVYHPHWVVLVPDSRVPGGLAVKAAAKEKMAQVLPPTNPGMPMFMDSPGYSVVAKKHEIKVLVPLYRVRGKRDFKFDAVTAYMQVDTSGEKPMLGVYQVYSNLSGDLSLPYKVSK